MTNGTQTTTPVNFFVLISTKVNKKKFTRIRSLSGEHFFR
ncbi:hypothetical protein GCM10008933_25980 [Paenibacillus motobuensis]|uniref:Uncharacterized protein n=1 Tax=Paenibacillus motobuensis TaxID=295324 RepID=A0ABN0YFZ8_9BACL